MFWFHRIVRRRYLLIIFTFHRIVPGGKAGLFYSPYDRGFPPEVLDKAITTIRKYLKIIKYDDFVECVIGDKKLEADSALITFDDADGDFDEYALPVLNKHDVCCTVFVPTGFVETGNLFWHVRISNLIHNLNDDDTRIKITNNTGLPDSVREIFSGGIPPDLPGRKALCYKLILGLNKLPDTEIKTVIDILGEIIEIKNKLPIGTMNWAQLKKIYAEGHSLESHSLTHRKLAGLNKDEVYRELVESKEKIEREIGNVVTGICYPAGSHSDMVAEQADRAGYKIGFTTRPGICRYPLYEENRFMIPRIDICDYREYAMHKILGMMVLKELFR
nr:polysaccharide deacetylase family protein [candidate division Zixibacteria bacterium]